MKNIACTNCYYVGTGKTPGGFVLEILLWVVFFPIGIIYTAYRYSKKNKQCPVCNSTAIVPSESRRGIEIRNREK